MSDRHCIRRIRLALGTDYSQAAGLTDRTRRLFHQRIRGLLDRLLQQASLPGHLLKAEQIVVELGSLPEAHFEEEFCRRLMRLLPGILHQQLRSEATGINPSAQPEMTHPVISDTDRTEDTEWSEAGVLHLRRNEHAGIGENVPVQPEMSRAGMSDNPMGRSVSGAGGRIYADKKEESFSSCCQVLAHYIRTALWTLEPSPDLWLSEQLSQGPASLRALVDVCLQMPQLGLPGRFFREKTLRGLIRKLAPGEYEHQPASPGTVLFASLHWYQNNTAVPVPAFPSLRHWPVIPLSGVDPERVLLPLTRPDLEPWCRALRDGSLSTGSLREKGDVCSVEALSDPLTENALVQTDEKPMDSRVKKSNKSPFSLPDTTVTAPAIPMMVARHVSPASATSVSENADGRQYVSHAGLSLLWPLLPELLQVTGIRQQDTRLDEKQRVEAVKLLVYLAERDISESLPCTTFSHWLCGVPSEQTQTIVPLSAEQAEKVDQWLETLPERIPGWQRLSGQDIRGLFLQREGWLCHDSNTLYLPPQPVDILLAQWPWPLTILLLPWLQAPLTLSLSLPPQK